ncbi:MAG: hypothetical protein GY864_11890 [Desulfobacterales bacterium]|nr:hypothetical protein [Desulfobacterales bacterium]
MTGKAVVGIPFFALIFAALLSGNSINCLAEDLTVKPAENSDFKAGLSLQVGGFYTSDGWFGKEQERLNGNCSSWIESVIISSFAGSINLQDAGTIYAGTSILMIGSSELDAAGSNLDDENVTDLDFNELYIGWKSGGIFSSLGEDSLNISAGRQDYQIGSGFMLWNGCANGGFYGDFWIAPRSAFDMSVLAGLDIGPFASQLFYLEPDDISDTRFIGANFEYNMDKVGSLGITCFNILESDTPGREHMDVYDIRIADFTPFSGLKSLSLAGDFVYEDLDKGNNRYAYYGEIAYHFPEFLWGPILRYRYAHFKKDYDSLFYGFSDWNTWYQGEFMGEYVLNNENLSTHTVSLMAEPSKDITLNLFYLDYQVNHPGKGQFGNPLGPMTSGHFADEVDFIVDWTYNSHLCLIGVVALAFPADGAKQWTGGTSTTKQFMLWSKYSF